MGTSLDEQLGRYHAVIHLRTPGPDQGYDHSNPLRTESATQALAIDALIAAAWSTHPRRFTIEPQQDFLDKARAALAVLRGLIPECCQRHQVPPLDLTSGGSSAG